jgi:class 3 adenylate cyclase
VAGPDIRRRTARVVSAARELNRNTALLAAVTRSRKRLLGDDQLAHRLASSRRRPADIAVRELGALRGDNAGVLGELGLVAIQAWQNLAEHRGRGRGDVDVAIMFTDLVGYSTWALDAGDEAAITLLAKVRDAIEPPIWKQRGDVVKHLGDGLMAAFWDARSASEAAFEAGERLSSIEVLGYRPRLRTGIHLGRPRKIGRDYFGIDVNIASRLAEAAQPGEVLISDRTLRALDEADAVAAERRLNTKGTPANLTAYVLASPRNTSAQAQTMPVDA